jgi:hypothetical protein
VIGAPVISDGYRGHVDLARGHGTIRKQMPGSRWLCVLVVTALVVLGASPVRAQVFKPRTGKAAVVPNKAPAAPASAAASTAAPGPASGSATPAVAKKTGPATPTTPAPTAKKATHGTAAAHKGKKRGKKGRDGDAVVIDDDEDEDVKITDD